MALKRKEQRGKLVDCSFVRSISFWIINPLPDGYLCQLMLPLFAAMAGECLHQNITVHTNIYIHISNELVEKCLGIYH